MHQIKFEKLFESLPSPHMVLDRELNFVAVNRAYEESVMRGRDEMLGRNLFDLFPNDGPGGRTLRDSFERVFATGKPDTLAYIPYDIPRPAERGGGMEKRYWTAVHTPLADGDGKVAYLVQNAVDVTEIVRLREAATLPFRAFVGEAQLVERAREAEFAHRTLMAESAEFRRMFQQAPGFIAVLSGPEHVFTFCNDAYTRLIGGREVIGRKVLEALPEVAGQGFFEMLEKVYATGEPNGGEGVRIELRRAPDEPLRETFIDFTYDAIKDLDGTVTGVFVQGSDRTDAVRTLKRQRLLLDELNHRVKNTLATVQSIAAQTLRAAPDLPTAKASFEARIIALSKAHNILSARHWSSAELQEIIRQEMAVHGERRIAYSGPSVRLNPKASIAVAMFIHELSMNSARHGALSGTDGRIDIVWHIDGEQALNVAWKESGGPPVKPPSRKGFGSRMINRVVTSELDGSYSCDHAPEGFRCEIVIPADSYGQRADAFEQ